MCNIELILKLNNINVPDEILKLEKRVSDIRKKKENVIAKQKFEKARKENADVMNPDNHVVEEQNEPSPELKEAEALFATETEAPVEEGLAPSEEQAPNVDENQE